MSTTSQTRPARGRRAARPSGDDRELAILETAERLLADRPLSEISVDDLAKGAGISRPTFYFYFPSKDAVLLTLLERVIAEADAALAQLIADRPADRRAVWRRGINVFFETFGAHRAVCAAATAGVQNSNSEARALWATSMQRWITHIAAVIEAERTDGAAPDTVPAIELSTALNLLNESVMTAAFAGHQPSIPDHRVLDNLVHIWTTSIYGQGL
ncbi:TetR/AcrR family transcriptional regulator [Mycolicibacterium vaccae]|uniref:TetR family transcriptional regulator n=1 Tax=Mycolicibacterium vaccae ATCC 25954 TaxID=1194972 RepID=K0V028_MYCVA|nr:TetR/AcrR family transcriptional regulator [Mycolicibacterium vaccae]ANI42645.1 TetR family transcriptional regulator [Mycolicibacterium vaccae 95051]EJZ10700.1 TetR family transcriptional regulator [Mycolicibacterium vaccae ATCC 25954]MCV7060165.1 TetR/AcrR family transcriptional regulator [Mycolicibacterium vaccae]